MPINRPNLPAQNLEQLLKEAANTPLNLVSPDFLSDQIKDDQVEKIIEILSNNFQLKKSTILTGIFLLFLKGAANQGTPISLSVELNGISFSKRDLINAYTLVTGNNHIRRLAEKLAVPIGQFAEKNGLHGELSQRINRELLTQTDNTESLSLQEMAWCSSFSQNIPNLKELSSERLQKLLALDYNKRFAKKTKANKNTEKKQQNKKTTGKTNKKTTSN
jgi:hypothetical protein